MPIKKIKLERINTTAGTDVRSEIRQAIIDEYADAAEHKAQFPPLVCFEVKNTKGEIDLLLADGFHRYFAFEKAGVKEWNVDVRQGTMDDALKFALKQNDTHGLRRSNADKRNCVEIALKRWSKYSGRTIAEICGVSVNFACEVKKEIDDAAALEESVKPRVVSGNVNENQLSSDDSCKVASTPPPPPPKRIGKDGKERSLPKPPPAPPKPSTMDATGIHVPEEIVPYWNQAMDESKRLTDIVSELRVRLKTAQERNEPMFREMFVAGGMSSVIANLDELYASLKRIKPHAVCIDCNGVNTKGCKSCHGRGFVSQFFWDNCVNDKKKKVAKRA